MRSANITQQPVSHIHHPEDHQAYLLAKKRTLQECINNRNYKPNYYDILSAISTWKLSNEEKRNILFECTDKNGFNFGMILAVSGDNHICQAYLDTIKILYEEMPPANKDSLVVKNRYVEFAYNLFFKMAEWFYPIKAEEPHPTDLCSFLATTNSVGHNLGALIAKSCDYETLRQYLALLLSLKDNPEIETKNVVKLISHNVSKNTLSLGAMVALHQTKEGLNLFLNALDQLIDIDLMPTGLIDYLTTQEVNGGTIGHLLAEYGHAEAIQVYLSFLDFYLQKLHVSALEHKVLYNAVYLLLESKDVINETIGHKIACFQDADMIIQYCRFLKKIYNKINSQFNIADVLGGTGKDQTNTIYGYMISKQDGRNLYKLLSENMFADMRATNQLAVKKEFVYEYIMTLPFEERKQALQNALTSHHPLHHFFAIKRRQWFAISIHDSMLTKIKMDLDALNKNSFDNNTYSVSTIQNLPVMMMPIPSAPMLEPSDYEACLYPAHIGNDQYINPQLQSTMIPASTMTAVSQNGLPSLDQSSSSNRLQTHNDTTLLPAPPCFTTPQVESNNSPLVATNANKTVSARQFSIYAEPDKKKINTVTEQRKTLEKSAEHEKRVKVYA